MTVFVKPSPRPAPSSSEPGIKVWSRAVFESFWAWRRKQDANPMPVWPPRPGVEL